MNTVVRTGAMFVAEHARARLTLVLLVLIPALFVTASGDVLGEFASALGGDIAADAATALGAGWAAAFLAGALAYFQVASARLADRRLALAGLGPLRVAAARIGAAIALALLASLTAYLALVAREDLPHPAHAAIGIASFALVYVGIGALVGALVRGELEGSLAVAFVFLIDVFSGPGMSDSGLAQLVPTAKPAELLMAAGAGQSSPTGDWIGTVAAVLVALAAAFVTFWLTARSRLR